MRTLTSMPGRSAPACARQSPTGTRIRRRAVVTTASGPSTRSTVQPGSQPPSPVLACDIAAVSQGSASGSLRPPRAGTGPPWQKNDA